MALNVWATRLASSRGILFKKVFAPSVMVDERKERREAKKRPSEPVTFVQRLPNVFQMSMNQRRCVPNANDVWNTLGSRCTNVAGSLGITFGTRWVVVYIY